MKQRSTSTLRLTTDAGLTADDALTWLQKGDMNLPLYLSYRLISRSVVGVYRFRWGEAPGRYVPIDLPHRFVRGFSGLPSRLSGRPGLGLKRHANVSVANSWTTTRN
jgi:hypothetical protein